MSRGLFPSELLEFELWWEGPNWLRLDAVEWPKRSYLPPNDLSEERDEICLHGTVHPIQPIFPLNLFPVTLESRGSQPGYSNLFTIVVLARTVLPLLLVLLQLKN